jgi:hypothetical protein
LSADWTTAWFIDSHARQTVKIVVILDLFFLTLAASLCVIVNKIFGMDDFSSFVLIVA